MLARSLVEDCSTWTVCTVFVGFRGGDTALLYPSTLLLSVQLKQTERSLGLLCSSFSNRFSCAFALVFAVSNVCVCVCVCV